MAEIKLKTSKAADIAKRGIGAAIAKDRKKVIGLLKAHGISVNDGYKDSELIVGVLQAMRTSDRFRADLGNLLAGMVSENPQAFTGEGDFFNFGPDLYGTDTAESTTTAKQPSAFSSLFTGSNLSNLFNTGLTVLSTSLTNKSNQKLAQTAKEIEEEKTKQAAYLAAASGKTGGNNASTGLSTGAKVGIAVGAVAVIGFTLWLVLKK